MITKETLLDKLISHKDEIISFLKGKKYSETISFNTLRSILTIKEKKNNKANEYITLATDDCVEKKIISICEERRIPISDYGKTVSVKRSDLANYYYNKNIRKDQEVFTALKKILGVFNPNYYECEIIFDNLNENRVRNAIIHFIYSLSVDSYPYINCYLDFINNKEQGDHDSSLFGNLIKTDAMPKAIYDYFKNDISSNKVRLKGASMQPQASDYIDAIEEMLNRDNIVKFMRHNKLLRNESGVHELWSNIKGNDIEILKEALYTYIGVVYALLEKVGKIDDDPTDGKCLFSIYFDRVHDDLVSPRVYEIEKNEKTEIQPKTEVPSHKLYELSRWKNYMIDFCNGIPPKEIEGRYLIEPLPLCILKKNVPTFFRHLNEVPKSDKDNYLVLAELEKQTSQSEKQTSQLENLTSQSEKQTSQLEKQTSLSEKQISLQKIILCLVGVILIGLLVFLIWGIISKKSVPNNLSPDQLVSGGDSLLRLENYEEAGLFYKEALAGYKEIAASNPNACIKLAEMYTLGKGAYSLDSALHYARMAKAEPTGCGHGWYVYILSLLGHIEEAEKQIPLAVDTNDVHMKLARSFFILNHNPVFADKEKLEKSFMELQSLNLIEARFACAYEYLSGVVVDDSTATDVNRAKYIIAPDIAKAIKTLSDLNKSCPASFILVGNLAKDFGYYNTAMMYYCMALQCGIDQIAPLILLMERHCHEMTLKEYKKFIQQARGLANEQKNKPAIMEHSISYRSSGSIKYAIETQERIIESIENREEDDFSVKLDINKKRLATLLMLSGDSANKERAIGIVSALENSTDTLAILSYLQAICHKLKDDADDKVRDSLVWFAADRGFLPAVATRLKTKHPIDKASNPNEYYINYRCKVSDVLLSKSPEIAYLVADMCIRDEAFLGFLRDGFVDTLYAQCLPFAPREYRIQDEIINFFHWLTLKKNETSIVKPDLKTFQELYDQSQIGLRAALDHHQVEMARQYCLFSYLLLKSANSFHGKVLAPKEMFIPFSDGRIDYLNSGGEIDNFREFFYQPLEYPYSDYLQLE